MKCLVLDFGGSSVKSCIMDENANMEQFGETPAPVAGEQELVDTVVSIYEKHKDEVEGIAISFPGMLDSDTGFLSGGGAYVMLWQKNILDILKPHIPVPISIENDGKCGALSEVWKGSLQDTNDSAVVIIGTGVAGGIIKDRKIHKGSGYSAGELSYLLVNPGEYGMQNTMCLKAAMMGLNMKVAQLKGMDSGNSALAAAATESRLFQDGSNNVLTDVATQEQKAKGTVDGKKIMAWVNEGDEAVTAIYNEFIQHIALMIHNLHIVFAPEKIALGGGISRDPRFFKDVNDELNRIYDNFGFPCVPTAHLVPCAYLGQANLAGAMYNYLQHFHPELIA